MKIHIIPFLMLMTPVQMWGQDVIPMTLIQVEEQVDDDEGGPVVDSSYLEQKQAQDLKESFRDLPDVAVGGAQRVAQKVYVRGLEDRNLNVTVDGARQSGYLFHHQGRLNLDPELMKRIEVEAGTGDALSGPGALGGSIRFETKDPEDLLPPGQNTGFLIKGKYNTNADEKGTSLAAFTRANERWSLLGYGSWMDSGNYQVGGGGSMPLTSGNPSSGLLKIVHRPSVGQKITLGISRTEDNATRLVRANFGYNPAQPVTKKAFRTLNTTLNYQYNPTNPAVDLEVLAYNSLSELNHKSTTSRNNTDFLSRGLEVQNTFQLDHGIFTVGADLNEDEAKSKSLTGRGEEKGEIYGLFSQYHRNLNKDWRLDLGLRFDDYQLQSLYNEEFADSHLSPNVGLQYKWQPGVSSRLSWSQAFRGPVPVEAFLLANATSVAPASDLKGTVADTTELSTLFKDSVSSFEITGYFTELRKPLESRIGSGEIQRYNNKDISVRGYQALYKRSWGLWDGSLYYSHNDVSFGGDSIGYSGNRGVALGDRVGMGLDYRWSEHNLWFSWRSLVVMKLTDVPASQVSQPGYDVHDFALSWFPKDSVRVGLALQNIFDRKYISQGSAYANSSGMENNLYEPGRDLRFSASYIF